MASHLAGIEYPKKKLEKAWKNLMFNQFHDILGGCCVKKAYEDAGYLYGEIMSITEQEINYALQAIAHKIDTLRGKQLPSYKKDPPVGWHIWETETLGTPVVAFNPHAWTVRMAVRVNAVVTKITDEKDNEIPFQIVRGDQTNGSQDKQQTIFMAEVAPMGYTVYRFFVEEESRAEHAKEFWAGEHTLENSRLKVDFDRNTGDICRIYDKRRQKVILDGACRAVLLDETAADTWAHDKVYLGQVAGYFAEPEFSLIEQGNVRAVLRVETRYNRSVLRRDYILEAGSDVIKVHAAVDFQEKHRTLKFAFPAGAAQTIAKIPFGTITRENGLGEEPCGSWIASGNLCIANDSKYGYDTTAGEVRLTVLRSAVYADHWGVRDEFCENMEQGLHEFTYALSAYESNAKAERKAEELNFGLRVVLDSFHRGTLAEKHSCFWCEGEHIVVTAVKQAEDDEDTIVRFYEADGVGEKVSMRVFGREIDTFVAHHEMKTFRTEGTEVNLIEWEEA